MTGEQATRKVGTGYARRGNSLRATGEEATRGPVHEGIGYTRPCAQGNRLHAHGVLCEMATHEVLCGSATAIPCNNQVLGYTTRCCAHTRAGSSECVRACVRAGGRGRVHTRRESSAHTGGRSRLHTRRAGVRACERGRVHTRAGAVERTHGGGPRWEGARQAGSESACRCAATFDVRGGGGGGGCSCWGGGCGGDGGRK